MRKKRSNFFKLIIMFIIGFLTPMIVLAINYSANMITFSPKYDLTSTNIQSALDEIYKVAKTKCPFTMICKDSVTYMVTLNYNGSDNEDGEIIVTKGRTYEKLPTKPTRDGYIFNGWYTAASGGTKIENTTEVELTDNQTLYAHWEGRRYTVTLEPDGGTVSPSYISVINGNTYSTLPTPIKEGYSFIGWYTSLDDGVLIENNYIVNLRQNQTLYAQWEQIPPTPYTITLNGNGINVLPSSITVYNGHKYSNLPTPTNAGFNFNGWYTAASGGTKIETTTIANLTGNQTLYAHWTAKKFTVSFNANGGNVTSTSTQVSYGGTYGTLPTPTRTGYTFDGWYTVSNGGTKVTSTTKVTITTNLTLYAHWTAIKVTNLTASINNTKLSINKDANGTVKNVAQITTTVTPANALNKSISFTSSDTSVASVDYNGKVTGINPGSATITVSTIDGSNKSQSFTVNVYKKVVIVVGASQVTRMKEGSIVEKYKDKVTSYTSKNYIYSTSNSSLVFINKSGSGIPWQYGTKSDEGYTKTANEVNKYKNSKKFVTINIYYPLSGNTIQAFTCDKITTSSNTIKGYLNGYNNAIAKLKKAGYSVNGHVISMHPVRPSQATNKKVVTNNNANACEKGYRSNYKYHKFNGVVMSLSSGYKNISYEALFREIMDTTAGTDSNRPTYDFKTKGGNGINWKKDYNTNDGVHWKGKAIQHYVDLMLDTCGHL